MEGAGASEAGSQTIKERALSKGYFQTSEIVLHQTKSRVPRDIHVVGVSAPYSNPYGSKKNHNMATSSHFFTFSVPFSVAVI